MFCAFLPLAINHPVWDLGLLQCRAQLRIDGFLDGAVFGRAWGVQPHQQHQRGCAGSGQGAVLCHWHGGRHLRCGHDVRCTRRNMLPQRPGQCLGTCVWGAQQNHHGQGGGRGRLKHGEERGRLLVGSGQGRTGRRLAPPFSGA